MFSCEVGERILGRKIDVGKGTWTHLGTNMAFLFIHEKRPEIGGFFVPS